MMDMEKDYEQLEEISPEEQSMSREDCSSDTKERCIAVKMYEICGMICSLCGC